MLTSRDRILTTHVGSLPRPADVCDGLFAQERGELSDPVAFHAAVAAAVDAAVARQVKAGIDIVSDGEMSKISYATYIKDRITGFDGDSPRRVPKDLEEFPTLMNRQSGTGKTPTYRRPKCIGPIAVKDMGPLELDIAHFQAALDAHKPAQGFMNAASPGVIALFQPNEHYPTHDAYLEALAEAMRPEYERIVDAGFILQLDSPDLGLGKHMMFKDRDEAHYVKSCHGHVDALNHALRKVPRDRVRMHVCWGNYEGPHHCDASLNTVLGIALRAKVGALLFEAANPRHAHEWTEFQGRDLPDGLVLIPGVIDSTTNFIEHPELVAQRIERYAHLVGRERVIAGTDCGFGTFAGYGAVDGEVAYAKLAALAEGARIASSRLWGRAAA